MEHGWVQNYLKAWHRRSGNRQETGRQCKQDDLASSDGLVLACFLGPDWELVIQSVVERIGVFPALLLSSTVYRYSSIASGSSLLLQARLGQG